MEYISTTLGRHVPIIFNSHKLGLGVGGEHTVITVILENGKKGMLMKLRILPKLLQILHDNKHSHKWRMHRTYVRASLVLLGSSPSPHTFPRNLLERDKAPWLPACPLRKGACSQPPALWRVWASVLFHLGASLLHIKAGKWEQTTIHKEGPFSKAYLFSDDSLAKEQITAPSRKMYFIPSVVLSYIGKMKNQNKMCP